MTTSLDKFGRVLIPKSIRDAVGLTPGTEIHLDIREEKTGGLSIVLTPETERVLVVREGNLHVYRGRLEDREFDLVEYIRKQRDERSKID